MLTFLHISDTHISGDPEYNPPWETAPSPHPNPNVRRLLEAVNRLPFPIDFILHTGDVCADPRAEDCRKARELLLQFPGPMYCLPGNHDSAELMIDLLHDGRRLHVLRDDHVEIAGYHLVTLDTNGAGNGDVHAPTISDAQIEAFAERMNAIGRGPTIVAGHHPLIETGVPWLDESMRVRNGERIHRLLRRHRDSLAGVFHGHIHQSMNTHSDGVLYVSCQSTWTNLAGYPGLGENERDDLTPGGFNLVMLNGSRSFVRRYHLARQ